METSGGAADPRFGDFADSLNLTERVRPYTPHLWSPSATPLPVLYLEDVSAIPFLADIPGVDEYQHRARVRADTGDLYATVTPPDERYDTYCAETLDIGQPEWVDAHTRKDPLAVARACLDRVPFARLVRAARAADGLVIHPYMSIEDVWILAAQMADESGSPVSVVGSPPPVTWIANDKDHAASVGRPVAHPAGVADRSFGTENQPPRAPGFRLPRRTPGKRDMTAG